MPNHCHNRVTFYASPEHNDQIAKIKQMFLDENIFTQIIPEPDWPNTHISESETRGLIHERGKVGELPVADEQNFGRTYTFKSTNSTDDRWYDWRIQNWDTKWDAYDVVVTDDDPESVEIEFNTAWSPPEAICNAIREQYEDVSVSWFYDEPGMEIAGYL